MFFDFDLTGVPFVRASPAHLVAVLGFVVLPLVLIRVFSQGIRRLSPTAERILRLGIASVGIGAELGLYIWYLANGGTDYRQIVPCYLCGAAIYLSSFAMLTRNGAAARISFFLLYGSFFAVLLPDLAYSWDRFGYYQFFITHGAIFTNVCYLQRVHGLYPTRKSFRQAALVQLGLLVPAALTTHAANANFFFLSWPPLSGAPVFQAVYDANHTGYTVLAVLCHFVALGLMGVLAKVAGPLDRDPPSQPA